MENSRKRTGSSTDSIYQPSLWYFDLLLFITDCETVREGMSLQTSVSEQTQEEEETGQENEENSNTQVRRFYYY